MGKKKRQKGRQRTGSCIHCGRIAPITEDHVFAQTLFREPRAAPIKVDVCQPCHTDKNLGEPTLRDMAYFSDGGFEHPDLRHHLEKTARATVKRRSNVGMQFESTGRDGVIVDRSSGRTLKRVHGITIAPETDRAAANTVRYIIRGLYVHEAGQPLPPTCPVIATRIEQLDVRRVLSDLWTQNSSPTFSGTEGNHIAQWDCWRHPTDPLDTIWIICLAQAAYFTGWTGNSAIRQVLSQDKR